MRDYSVASDRVSTKACCSLFVVIPFSPRSGQRARGGEKSFHWDRDMNSQTFRWRGFKVTTKPGELQKSHCHPPATSHPEPPSQSLDLDFRAPAGFSAWQGQPIPLRSSAPRPPPKPFLAAFFPQICSVMTLYPHLKMLQGTAIKICFPSLGIQLTFWGNS